MKTLHLSAVVLALVAGTTVASAQSVVTTPHGTESHGSVTFAPEHGAIIREHATSEHFNSVQDPNVHVQVGGTLPPSVGLHPLPDRIVTQVPGARSYQYGVVNNRHVVVEPGTRRVIHSFD
jgi:hypothetical protein